MSFRSAREKAGLTVLDVAKALGVSDAAVYYWETGKFLPKSSRLKAVAELFGCTVDDLLKDDSISLEVR